MTSKTKKQVRRPKRPIQKLKAFAEGVYQSSDESRWLKPQDVSVNAYGYEFTFSTARVRREYWVVATATTSDGTETIDLGPVGPAPVVTTAHTVRVVFKTVTIPVEARSKNDAVLEAQATLWESSDLQRQIIASAHYIAKVDQ